MSGYDSIQVRFKNVKEWPSLLANTRTVPFINSYFDVIKSCIDNIRTEYFWVFASFLKLDTFDFDFIPEQFEKDQIHVWYATHPMAGLNQEGNIMLIPTKQFKEQLKNLKFLRDYKDVNYHADPVLWQPSCPLIFYKLKNPIEKYYNEDPVFYKWMINKDLQGIKEPNFYPSFWEDEKLYSWGKTKDIMLVPHRENIKQFYDFDRTVHFDFDYNVKPMDIVFISYDEPKAEERFNKLKSKFPRAKWSKGVVGQTLAYMSAAMKSETDYFFAVFPKIDIVEDFNFDFQPDRMKNPCHYIFDCYNEVIDCTYGHDGVILYNKQLVMETHKPGLDFTLSKPVTVVPVLSAINKLDETPLLAWRTAFREVLKLKLQMPTVESRYRLKKWTTLGKGDNAQWVYLGAKDALQFIEDKNDVRKSYDFDWIKNHFEEHYG
jgi:hypothetical protein